MPAAMAATTAERGCAFVTARIRGSPLRPHARHAVSTSARTAMMRSVSTFGVPPSATPTSTVMDSMLSGSSAQSPRPRAAAGASERLGGFGAHVGAERDDDHDDTDDDHRQRQELASRERANRHVGLPPQLRE